MPSVPERFMVKGIPKQAQSGRSEDERRKRRDTPKEGFEKNHQNF